MEEEIKNAEFESAETSSKSAKSSQEKRIKNLISAVILLGGLLLGSLFVDVIQLVRGGGFSPKKLAQTDIFNFGGKTWVAYSEPIVKVQVISDESCEACKPDEIVLGLHRMVPTILTEKVDQGSKAGEDLIKTLEIKTLPAFVFSQDVEKTDFFKQASAVLTKKDNAYLLKTAEIGIQPGKYLESPAIKDNDIQMGNKDSKAKIFIYSDFQCPYCKAFHANIMKKLITTYGDKISVVFRNYPLSFHTQAENAAMAGECANEQGKFIAYSDKLFAEQSAWGKTQGVQSFKTYAQQTGMNVAQFNQCLDEKKYADKINSDKESADSFGISGTPSIFINDQFVSSGLTFAEIQKIVDENLAK